MDNKLFLLHRLNFNHNGIGCYVIKHAYFLYLTFIRVLLRLRYTNTRHTNIDRHIQTHTCNPFFLAQNFVRLSFALTIIRCTVIILSQTSPEIK